ncbi:MAG: aquaporin [Pyrinomonadaceae bacterium]
MLDALKNHWPEYLIEAWCLGMFMVSACGFGVALFHPGSPVAAIDSGVRTVLMGLAMGLTAIGIVCSPWGKRSGAHFNPAVTITFFRLGKINREDACFYVLFQTIGGIAGVLIASFFLGDLLADSSVNFVITVPGGYGVRAAFAAEVVISFLMMTTILFTSNSPQLSRYTPYFAGTLVALFIAVESPISGMSMNPARTLASAIVAGNWTAMWIYLLAPPIAMLTAAEFFVRVRGIKYVLCAKLNHFGRVRCIFNCNFGMEN